MITGSHNPPEYNGFKIVINDKTLSTDDIQTLYKRIIKEEYLVGEGEMSNSTLSLLTLKKFIVI